MGRCGVESRRSVDRERGIFLLAVLLGWGVAVVSGLGLDYLLRALYRQVAGPLSSGGGFSTTVVVVSLVAGFLAYLLGGFVAGRLSPRRSGLSGAVTATVGLALGVVLALFLAESGRFFTEAVALPPANFGFSGKGLLSALSLFLANLFGGYVGGKLGEPSYPDVTRRG
jgi:uncharacterized membrane protein